MNMQSKRKTATPQLKRMMLFFLVIKSFVTVYSQFMEDNDSCTSDSTCKTLRFCTEFHEPIKRGFRPKLCGFQENTPMVCCPTNAEEILSRSKVQEKETLSEIMCNIYLEDICSSSTHYIVRGEPAGSKELPFMARIGYISDITENIIWLCGGTLISNNFVLSAAHCTKTKGKIAKWVRLGELDASTDTDDAKPEDFQIVERINHPDYNPRQRYNDIALYKLDRYVTFNEYIQPICLQWSDTVKNIKSVTAAGWGLTETGKPSNKLMKVNLKLYHIRACENFEDRITLPRGLNEKTHMCSGVIEEGRDTCGGDSGGPLFVSSKNIKLGRCTLPTQIGITSFGTAGCGIHGYAAVYTKVSAFRNWIEPIVWKEFLAENVSKYDKIL